MIVLANLHRFQGLCVDTCLMEQVDRVPVCLFALDFAACSLHARDNETRHVPLQIQTITEFDRAQGTTSAPQPWVVSVSFDISTEAQISISPVYG